MFRLIRPISIAGTFLSVFALQMFAQRSAPDRSTSAEIQVRVTYENDRATSEPIRVDLLNETGISVQQTFTDSEGRAQFHVTAPGTYHIRATGINVEDGMSDGVRIDEMDRARIVFVRVRPKTSQVESARSSGAGGPVTSAAELRIPQDARKDFQKGMDAWQKKDFQKAADYFEKATATYPQYDTAFNNLGVMYAHLNQPEKARAAFEHSVQLNDKNADADRNLARMMLRDKDFVHAEELLQKSLVVEPLNPISLTLVSIAEFETGKYDAAVRDARKVHEVPHDGYALSHFVAGQALEREHRYQEAGAEYMTYLRESPSGPEAPQVKNALARLTAANTAAPPNAQ